MRNRFAALIAFKTILIISIFFTVLFIAGSGISCQSQAPTPTPTSGLPQVEVAIEGFAFKPATLNIPVGTTVVWHNNDSVTHTVTARDNSFDSGGLSRGSTFSFTFKQKGTIEYYCQLHSYMTGKVTVE